MAFLDKITELAVNVGDKANEAMELSRLTVQQKGEEKALRELKQKLGELYLQQLRISPKGPQEVLEVYGQICEGEKRLADVTAEIEAKRAEEAAAPNYGQANCPGCGAENTPGAKFCARCGGQLGEGGKKFCTQCGQAVEPGGKFCPACGVRQE